jgi:hypothetical protein
LADLAARAEIRAGAANLENSASVIQTKSQM